MSEMPSTYVDRPDCLETFAEHVEPMMFDGHVLRTEFSVLRFDPLKPSEPPTARRYPVCRLLLTPKAAVDLYNQLANLLALMEQQGVATRQMPEPGMTQ